MSEDHCQVVHGPATSVGHHQATHGPAASERHCQVAQDPAPSEEHYCFAMNGGHHQVMQGPAMIEEHCQAVQFLPEKEEKSTGSKDKNGGSACENMQDITSKNGTHLGPTLFEDLWHQVLMEFAEPSPISSDGTPAFLCDCPKLYAACAKLMVEANNKELDLVTWWQIQEMLGLLNLYLDAGLHLSWRKTSILVLMSQREGNAHA